MLSISSGPVDIWRSLEKGFQLKTRDQEMFFDDIAEFSNSFEDVTVAVHTVFLNAGKICVRYSIKGN